MKISIISKTLRIHDNPFLDSDLYIIYIDKKEYGHHQKLFLDNILLYHIKDLNKIGIKPFLLKNLYQINHIKNKYDTNIYVDYLYPNYKYPFNVIYIPSWCLVNWRENSKDDNIYKLDLIKEWFLPEALKNHKKFKEFVKKNIRNLYKIKANKSNKYNNLLQSNYLIDDKNLKLSSVIIMKDIRLKKIGLDKWILEKLESTKYMKNVKWFKPNTCPTTSIMNESNNIPDKLKTSKLSPFISLGVISPLEAYNFWNGENRMGSSRDQLLFREMFHACGQLNEFWDDNFGKEYNWKKLDKRSKKWRNFINGTTEYEDLNWAIIELNKNGWIHHLARHLIADYLTRGKLEIHWKYGMDIFKEELVDHDKCVNRANWMWLSGTAFSSKQRSIFHYNYDNYLKNKNKKLKY